MAENKSTAGVKNDSGPCCESHRCNMLGKIQSVASDLLAEASIATRYLTKAHGREHSKTKRWMRIRDHLTEVVVAAQEIYDASPSEGF